MNSTDKKYADLRAAGIHHLLRFNPYYKSVIWGGKRIAAFKRTEVDSETLGESWELSSIPGHETTVSDGPLKGATINDLITAFGPEFLGTEVWEKYGPEFPLLIKIIDANDDLSVQVHPDDSTAVKLNGPGARGKTEMWYVLDANPDSKIYVGLKEELNPASFEEHIKNDTIMDVVAAHPSEVGQFYLIPAGTVHAIGAGNLIAEVQQPSDITYRLFDYNRTDTDGRPRLLHLPQAAKAIDFHVPLSIQPKAVSYPATRSRAVTCGYFRVDYLHIGSEAHRVVHDSRSFTVLMTVSGDAEVVIEGERLTLHRGHTVLIPAAARNPLVSGPATLLRITPL